MDRERLRQLDLLPAFYFHVPFCSSKCAYCDFFSLPGSNESLQAEIVEGSLDQARWALAEIAPEKIDTFYTGGGTPNSLSPAVFRHLIKSLSRLAETYKVREWTVELNPEHTKRNQIEMLGSAGVSRISMGIQSFSDSRLSFLGRRADRSCNLRALDLLKKTWKGEFNLDLITALPGQGINEALEDLDMALNFEPDHLSLYGLSFEEGTELHRRMEKGTISPLQQEEYSDILLALWHRLSERAYIHYEVSNFSKKGRESRHNLHYWHMDPYLGVGPGGVSTLPLRGPLPIRLETRRDIVNFPRHSISDSGGGVPREFFSSLEKIRPEEFLLEYLMMGLRTRPGVDLLDFFEIFGAELPDLIGRTLMRYDGLLERIRSAGGREFLGPTEEAMLLLDSILTDAAVEIGEFKPELRWPRGLPDTVEESF
jgi:oxygen-independent coproporphyrinogen-3 oxidase